jgi:hypothetical protein
MNTATFIRKLDGWKSDARLYRLKPPLKDHEYVIVSAVSAQLPKEIDEMMQMIDNTFGELLLHPLASGLETLIFAAEKDGAPKGGKYHSLTRGIRGELDHGKALLEAGYVVMKERNHK